MTARIAGVFAHPDDDVYLLGGSLLLAGDDAEPSLLFATNGGAGPISEPQLATRETLGSVRESEQRRSLELLGHGGARVDYLGHPDYYLPDVPMDRLVGEVGSWLEEVRPHVVVTFGPDGLTSHHDHIHIGAAATAAFHRLRGRNEDGAFQRLYHAVMARSDVDRFYDGVRAGGYAYGEEGNLFDITGVDDDRVAVRVDTREVRDRKYEAILVHATQMVEHVRFPEPLRWIYLDYECFAQIHPSAAGGETRGSLFDDLAVAAR